jgi:hypothetical protein
MHSLKMKKKKRIMTLSLSGYIIGKTDYKECKIWGFHSGDYDDYHLLGDDAVWLL